MVEEIIEFEESRLMRRRADMTIDAWNATVGAFAVGFTTSLIMDDPIYAVASTAVINLMSLRPNSTYGLSREVGSAFKSAVFISSVVAYCVGVKAMDGLQEGWNYLF